MNTKEKHSDKGLKTIQMMGTSPDDCSQLRGDCSELSGDCTGVTGDLGACELTPEDRKKGVSLLKLVKNAE